MVKKWKSDFEKLYFYTPTMNVTDYFDCEFHNNIKTALVELEANHHLHSVKKRFQWKDRFRRS